MSESSRFKPKVISFDCAQTLLEVDWSIPRYVADLCARIGLDIPVSAPRRYEEMYGLRLGDYIRVNQTRDHAQCDAWWLALGQDWLREFEIDPAHAEKLQETSWRLGFGAPSILFRLYDDVLEILPRLREQGIRLAVLSNWDYTLQRALNCTGIGEEFDLVVASLEYGVEKPHRDLFNVMVDHFGVESWEILHVGDNPEDDFAGARGAGMRAVLLDRSQAESVDPVLHDLRQIERVFEWTF